MSNVEQLDVLNGPVMTAEHDGHMDGPHWDLTAGTGPTGSYAPSERKEEAGEWGKSQDTQHNFLLSVLQNCMI